MCKNEEESLTFRRSYGKSYYIPEVFHDSPTYNCVVPVFIRDINKSSSLIELYGSRGIDPFLDHFIMVNNYPIQRVSIGAKIQGEIHRDDHADATRNHIMLNVDDFSDGELLSIWVKCWVNLYTSSGLGRVEAYGKIVEIEGIVIEVKGIKSLVADNLVILGDNESIDVEIQCWKKRIEVRNALKRPWVYSSKDNLLQSCLNKIGTMHEDTLTPAGVSSGGQPGLVFSCGDTIVEASVTELDIQIIDDLNSLTTDQIGNIDESQLLFDFLEWILEHGNASFKLAELMKSNKIRFQLYDIAKQKLSKQNLAYYNGLYDSLKLAVNEIFHYIRHILQEEYKLIEVTKSQTVYPKTFFCLASHIKDSLRFLKFQAISKSRVIIFNVENYLQIFRQYSSNLVGNVNYKILNYIVDWILANDLNDRNLWRYDSKRKEWSYLIE